MQEITKPHILKALNEIDAKPELRKGRASSTYDLIYEGKDYPPKLVISIANKYATGVELKPNEFEGGLGTPSFTKLNQLGFVIKEKENLDPWQSIVNSYKEAIIRRGNLGELYKWRLIKNNQPKFDIKANDFRAMIRSIEFKNLIFHNGIASLYHMVDTYPEEVRQCFLDLFNDTQPLEDRMDNFTTDTLKIYRKVEPARYHHQDERTIATYLTFKEPSHYTFYKDTFYQKLCRKINEAPKKPKRKYIHYLDLVKSFIDNYVINDPELLDLKTRFLTDDCYKDEDNLIFTQDILYQVLDNPYSDARKYWRIGTKDDDRSIWQDMRDGSYISIGWPELPDLSSVSINKKNDIIKLMDTAGYYPADKGTKSRKSGEIFNFLKNVKTGDIVLAQDGATVLGIGEISDDYEYDPELYFPHLKPVNWILIEPAKLTSSQGLRTTVYEVTNLNTIEKVNSLLSQTISTEVVNKKTSKNMPSHLNTILYGPPGTGKTYATIEKAIRIVNPDFEFVNSSDPEDDRKLVKEEYQRLKEEGYIEFVTFHQSLGYEDFIEGIKPLLYEEGKDENELAYNIEDGIFKRLATLGKYECYKVINSLSSELNSLTRAEFFNEAYQELIDLFEQRLDGNKAIELKTKTDSILKVHEISANGNIRVKHAEGQREEPYTVSKKRLQKLFIHFEDLKRVTNVNKAFKEVIGGSNYSAYWAVLNKLNELYASVKDRVKDEEPKHITDYEEIKTITEDFSIEINSLQNKNPKKIVLIIDEINRGNVSQIFGELITLIEDDKRAGKIEFIESKLPYSKEWFSVPPNLYIIGTMNTADRSVEALDTALRRRFVFEPVMPQPELLQVTEDGIELNKLLTVINERLSILKDKDHVIGHAWLWNVKSVDELKKVFENKILPLLQEYFFNDYEKMGLVLGDGFFNAPLQVKPGIFASFKSKSGLSQQYNNYYQYTLKPISILDKEAFVSIYTKPSTEPDDNE